MPNKLTERLRGSLSTLLYFFNTLFWFIPIFLLGLLKLPLPLKGWRTLCTVSYTHLTLPTKRIV